MVASSVAGLISSLRTLPVLTPEQQVQLPALQQQFPDVKALVREMIRRNWLTPYQANQLARDKAHELVLDQYVLLEMIGQGGMGSVYKARQVRMNRLVAVKVVRREALKSPVAVERFLREARAAAMLAHPNIVTVFDNNAVNDTHFLVMEFLEGTDLSRLVKEKGPLPLAQACEYVRQAALGLQHAHEQKLVHRDVKPHNLMLTKDGVVKVMDMGLARTAQSLQGDSVTEGLTDSGAVMGTVDYISPEQARNAKTVDIRADVYSLGCTLYHLLAGRVPFAGETMTEKLLQHQLEEPEVLEQVRPDVPAALGAVVRKMMAKKAEDRYQTPAHVAKALEPFCRPGAVPAGNIVVLPRKNASGGETVLEPYSMAGLLQTVSRRRRLVMAAAAVFGVLLFSLLLWLVFRTPRSTDPRAQAAGPTRGATTSAATGPLPTVVDPGARQQSQNHYQLGRLASGRGNYEEAIKEYSEAIRLDPTNYEAMNDRGNVYKTLREYAKAIEDYNRAIQIKPTAPNPYVGRGAVYFLQDKDDEALKDFNKAIELDANFAFAYNGRANIYFHRGDYDTAIKDFDRAIQIMPRVGQFYLGRGRAYAKKGNQAQAESDFKTAVKLDASLANQAR